MENLLIGFFVLTIVYIGITTVVICTQIDRKFKKLREALNLPEED